MGKIRKAKEEQIGLEWSELNQPPGIWLCWPTGKALLVSGRFFEGAFVSVGV